MAAKAPREAFPDQLSPMLAKAGKLPDPDPERWAYEIKWDGIRALGFARRGKWRMQSRRLEDVSARYPELQGLGEALADRAIVVDGEVVALDERGRPSFQLVQRRMGLTSPAAVKARLAETPVNYVVFDLLHLDGRNLRGVPYSERRALLAELPLEGPRWSCPAHRLDGGPELLEAARRQGLEGVVAKRLDSPYREGRRSGEWIKERVWRRQEFVIGGQIPGEGRRAERVGSLLVGYYDRSASELKRGVRQRLVFAGGVGSGLKEADIELLTRELRRLHRDESPFEIGGPRGPKARLARFCEPEFVCGVYWTEWTQEGTLRQPAFKGMRTDVDPREVVREVFEREV
ncbi:MAG: non-homologous end-joining DNA ligase [Actinomycetota bacterium]|nr:non-homologous end-joining DNA ligase [Actinomycetota bacterium]